MYGLIAGAKALSYSPGSSAREEKRLGKWYLQKDSCSPQEIRQGARESSEHSFHDRVSQCRIPDVHSRAPCPLTSTQAASAPYDSSSTIRDANVALRADLRDPDRLGRMPSESRDARLLFRAKQVFLLPAQTHFAWATRHAPHRRVGSCIKAPASSFLTYKPCERLCR